MQVHIGASGWAYSHWRGIFYPADLPARAWFSFYARHFHTVEINNTFYRLPAESAFEAWRLQAPAGFIYALKASRYLTHIKRLKEPEAPLQLFLSRASLLGPHLGPILYQLPPHWSLDLGRLEHFLQILPADYQHVLEFRHPSWLCEEVFSLLERYGVALCIHDMPPLEVPLRVTAPLVYVRFHGGPDYFGDYSDAELAEWAERIVGWCVAGYAVYVYFNNDALAYAVKNALTLCRMLGLGQPASEQGDA